MVKRSKSGFILLGLVLFTLRLCYGLVSEFWFVDELQIYLIGLKSYTTQTWPYYGPDVVYTQTQISGGLQGIMVSASFYLLPIPESPVILLNILSFFSLSLLAFYISKRLITLPSWLIWVWVMTLTWTMDYSTRVVNPSYAIVFSIPFFVCLFDALPIYDTQVISKKYCFFVLGITTFLIMQIHLSYVLLFPFIALAFYFDFKSINTLKEKLAHIGVFLIGALIGIATLVPTWFLDDNTKSISSNVLLNLDNYKNAVTILVRYLSFATYEIPYILGGSTSERLKVITSHYWMVPFTIYLFLFGCSSIGIFVFMFFKNKNKGSWQKIRNLTVFGFVILFVSFFFSIKAPSSHTYYLLLPLPVMYSFYCYEWLWINYPQWKKWMYGALVSVVVFYTGLGLYNFKNKSLYKDRQQVQRAIDEKNYKLLGERRSDVWGYGY